MLSHSAMLFVQLSIEIYRDEPDHENESKRDFENRGDKEGVEVSDQRAKPSNRPEKPFFAAFVFVLLNDTQPQTKGRATAAAAAAEGE